jgi:glycosyltransferase involved in cell wall biosynthesis
MFFETFSTLVKAIFLKKQEKYDIIHLRDGDPFLFLLLLLNFFTKDCKWVVFVFMDPNSGVLQKINYAKIWLPIYRRSLSRNRLLFLCENDLIKQELEKIMPDLFAKKVIHLPLPANYVGSTLPKAEARQHLMLPKNKAILLSFGSHHSGKNPEVVVRASRDLPDVYLLLAGKIPPNVTNRVKSIKNHLIIKNYYIPEKEKQLYFCASDAIVLSYNKTFLKRNPAAMLWDACKFGIPIIASDGGQLGKLVRLFQLGLLFEPENELSLRKAILCFLSLEPKKLKTLKKNCERFCTEFSTQKWSEQIKRIYDYLLKEPFNELPF